MTDKIIDFRQAQGAAEPAPTRLPPPDDDELAVVLREDWRNKVAYFHNSWWVYEGGAWVSRDQHEVNRHIRQFLRTQRQRGVSVNQRRITSLAAMMIDDVYMSNRRVSEHQAEASRYINLPHDDPSTRL